jgi:hypothetical protein
MFRLSCPAITLVVALLLPFCCSAAGSAAPAQETVPVPSPGTVAETPIVDAPLELLVGKLPLPFSYRPVSNRIGVSTSLGLTAEQDLEVMPVDGPRAGKPFRIRVVYISPKGVPAGFVQTVVNQQSEKFAADARTRVVKPVRIEDFDFMLADAVIPFDGAERRTIRLMGTISGNLVNIFVPEDLEGEGPSPLVDVLAGLDLDYTAALRFRARLEAESKRAIAGDRLLTPVGAVEEPRKIDAKLVAAIATYDGSGKLVGASHSYGFFKVGFWAVQSFGLTLTCNLGMPEDEAARKRLADPFDANDKSIERISSTRTRVGGLDATRQELRQTSTSGMITRATRWYGEHEGGYFVARIDRFSSRMQALKLEEQLSEMNFACRPESVLGMDPVVDASPAAPKAPAVEG